MEGGVVLSREQPGSFPFSNAWLAGFWCFLAWLCPIMTETRETAKATVSGNEGTSLTTRAGKHGFHHFWGSSGLGEAVFYPGKTIQSYPGWILSSISDSRKLAHLGAYTRAECSTGVGLGWGQGSASRKLFSSSTQPGSPLASDEWLVYFPIVLADIFHGVLFLIVSLMTVCVYVCAHVCFLGHLPHRKVSRDISMSTDASVVTGSRQRQLWRIGTRFVRACAFSPPWTQLLGIHDVSDFQLTRESEGSSCSLLSSAHSPPFSLLTPFYSLISIPPLVSSISMSLLAWRMLPKPITLSLSVWGWISQWEGGDGGLRPHSHCGFLPQSEVVAGCQRPCSLGFPVSAEPTSLVSRQGEYSYNGRGHVWSLGSRRGGALSLYFQGTVYK